MSQQHIDIWRQTAEAFDQRYQAIDDRWDGSSPCDGWSVRDLVDHTVGVQQGVAAGVLGADVAEGAAWPEVHQAMNAALEREDALEGMAPNSPFGPMPKSVLFGIVTSDLLLHTWDLARAVEADETLPPEAVAATWNGLQRLPEEVLRAEGMFGPAIEVADDADPQTKLLAHTGRKA